ncbi:MAG: MbtH family NRPS accessory protein [Cyanothece sp. SIO1E1]|nr:MbtH family NRPS accessory protein [Cyanothece sp. SIO1E1]
MYQTDQEDTTLYNVVINHEEQYSIWPVDKEIPYGWQAVDKSGPKAECLAYIKEVWTDMRPLSLRQQMEAAAAQSPAPQAEPEIPVVDDLIQRLSQGEHPVEVTLRPERTAIALKERIDMGYVHIKFTSTRGGTDLGVQLDREASQLEGDFNGPTGTIHLVGNLTLNYVKVRCIADITLDTLTGTGHLEVIESDED